MNDEDVRGWLCEILTKKCFFKLIHVPNNKDKIGIPVGENQ